MRSSAINFLQMYSAIKSSFIAVSDKLENLALGSSHGQYGFNSNLIKNTYNLCTSSQDLKYSYLLYEKSIGQCRSLKNIILFYSIFSPGFVLEKSKSEVPHAIALNQAFSLNVKFQEQALIDIATELDLLSFSKNIVAQNSGFPPLQFMFFPNEYKALNRASDHVKYNKTINSLCYLFQIFALAKKFNHKVFIVLPPYRSDYKHSLQTLGANRYCGLDFALSMVQSYFKPIVLDFYNCNTINDDDFGDFDHLNPLGAGPAKISHIILNQMIKL